MYLKRNNTDNKTYEFDDNGNRVLYVYKNVLLQKWNNIIINYDGGTLDIFINGELVKSNVGVIPYHSNDMLTTGEENGANGGICSVMYFDKVLKSNNIKYLYSSVKNDNPPIMKDLPITIIKNDFSTLGNSF